MFQIKKKDNIYIKYKYIIDILITIFIQLFLEAVIFLIFYNGRNISLIFQRFSIYAMIIFENFIYKRKVYILHFISLFSLFYFSFFHRSFTKNLIYGKKLTSYNILFLRWNYVIYY